MVKHNKKGDLSINIIIVAAISLAVLVILFMIFTGRLNIFSKGVDTTQKAGYACVCADPSEDRVCAAASSTGHPNIVKKKPECNNAWTDCPLDCFSK